MAKERDGGEGLQTASQTSLRCAQGYDIEATPRLVFAELGSRKGPVTHAICRAL